MAQGKALALARDILQQRGINPVISDGTVLGVVREGDFIPWDWDAEIFVTYEEVRHKGKELVMDFINGGFKISHRRFGRRNWKIVVEKYNFLIEIRAWYQERGYFKRRDDMGSEYQIPKAYMLQRKTVVLRGENYLAPLDYEGYLTHVYGDWQTPVKSDRRRSYLNSDFFRPGTIKRVADYVKQLLGR